MLERLFHNHLEEGEPLYMTVHKHWLLGIRALFVPLLFLVGTLFIMYKAPIRPVVIVMLLADVFIAVWLLRNFYDYFLDAWIITDRAVIDVAWHGWFHRQSTRIDYASIEGVSYEIIGIPGTLFGYGTITIEKVGSGSLVSIECVKHPKDIESIILACQYAHVRTRNLKDTDTIKDILAEIVAERVYLDKKDAEDDGA